VSGLPFTTIDTTYLSATARPRKKIDGYAMKLNGNVKLRKKPSDMPHEHPRKLGALLIRK
jgi:hypothetical protein